MYGKSPTFDLDSKYRGAVSKMGVWLFVEMVFKVVTTFDPGGLFMTKVVHFLR